MPSVSSSSERKPQLWKAADAKAQKRGDCKTVYWVKEAAPPSSIRSLTSHTSQTRSKRKFNVVTTYTGEWLDNRKHGFGRQHYPSGDVYEGQWQCGVRHGDGSQFQLIDGQLVRVYTGEWRDDHRHGKGVALYSDGSRYEGQWFNDQRHGHGSLFHTNGDTYTGEWRHGDQSGFGSLCKANGDIYEGLFHRGHREGQGLYYYANKGKMFDGEWKDDLPATGIIINAKDYFDQLSSGSRPVSSPSSQSQSLIASLLSAETPAPVECQELPVLRMSDADGVLAAEMEALALERSVIRSLPSLPPNATMFADRPGIHSKLRQVFESGLKSSAAKQSLAVSDACALLETAWDVAEQRGGSLSRAESLAAFELLGGQSQAIHFRDFGLAFWLAEMTRASKERRTTQEIKTIHE